MALFGPPNVQKMKDKKDVKGLIKALSYKKSIFVCREAAVALGDLGDTRAVEPLIADINSYHRKEVIVALGKIRDERAVEPFISILKNRDESIRQASIEGLVRIGLPAVDLLISALKNDNYYVRESSAKALGSIKDPRAIEPLISALPALYAAESLKALGWHPDNGQVGAAYWVALEQWDHCVELGEPSVPLLISALKEHHWSKKPKISEALVKIGAAVVLPVIALIKDKGLDKDTHEYARKALKAVNDIDAVEPFIEALNDEDLMEPVIYALGQIGDPRAIGPLVKVLDKNILSVRVAVCKSLAHFGALAVEPLITYLEDKDNSSARDIAEEILGQIGDKRALKALITALRDEDDSVRKAAVDALKEMDWIPDDTENGIAFWIESANWNKCVRIGSPAVELLLAALKNEECYPLEFVAETLGKIRDPRAVQPLISALSNRKETVRKAAVEALVQIGLPTVEILISALKSSNEHIFRGSVETLTRIGDLRAVEPLIIMFQDKNQYTDRDIVASALGRIGDTRSVEPLIDAIRNENFFINIRAAAAKALGEIGDARAVEPLIEMLHCEKKINKEENEFRRSAAKALLALYRRGSLTEQLMNLILDKREIIINHSDRTESTRINCFDSETTHYDYGIGVDFPL